MSLMPTILNWYGGKQKLSRQIISMFPEHKRYVEVFMGSAAVFFNKPKAQDNILNDFNGNLVNLFTTVRDNYDELAEKCFWTLNSREEYKKFYKLHQNGYQGIDNVTRAMMYLFLVRSSFNAQIDTDFSEANTTTFNMLLLARLKLAREKLDKVVIENMSFEKVIAKYDKPGTLMFLDPPYYVTSEEVGANYYEFVFKTEQHDFLKLALKNCKCDWYVTYDDRKEIVDLYKEYNLYRLGVKYLAGNSNKMLKKEELIITNYKAKRPQLDAFDEETSFDFKFNEVTDEERDKMVKEVQLDREKFHEQELKLKREKPDVVRKPIENKGSQSDLFAI